MFSFIIVLGIGFYKDMDLVKHQIEALKYEEYVTIRKIQ